MDYLSEYKYLWDGSESGWVLIKTPNNSGDYTVFNKFNRVFLHFDDPKIKEIICNEMIKRNCEQIDDFPQAGEAIVTPE